MSENTPQDPTAGYDPADDADSDPDSLNPRRGDQASGEAGDDQPRDPDADPDMLNPRTGDQAVSGDEL